MTWRFGDGIVTEFCFAIVGAVGTFRRPPNKPPIMNLLATIVSKIFGHATPAAPAPQSIPATAAATPAVAEPAAPTPPAPVVDVTAILDDLASKNSEKLDWRKSIVDLLKLVGMESSLSARKELAAELHFPGDTGDSAAMNVWLHKEVIKKLAANGGKVPAELLD